VSLEPSVLSWVMARSARRCHRQCNGCASTCSLGTGTGGGDPRMLPVLRGNAQRPRTLAAAYKARLLSPSPRAPKLEEQGPRSAAKGTGVPMRMSPGEGVPCQPRSPFVVSLSRTRKVPRGFSGLSSSRSDSRRVIFPKYHLQEQGSRLSTQRSPVPSTAFPSSLGPPRCRFWRPQAASPGSGTSGCAMPLYSPGWALPTEQPCTTDHEMPSLQKPPRTRGSGDP